MADLYARPPAARWDQLTAPAWGPSPPADSEAPARRGRPPCPAREPAPFTAPPGNDPATDTRARKPGATGPETSGPPSPARESQGRGPSASNSEAMLRRVLLLLVLAAAALPAGAVPAEVGDLSDRISTYRATVGAGTPSLEIRFGPLLPDLNSPLEVVLTSAAPHAGERWRLLLGREDHLDPAYRFTRDARAEEVAAAPRVAVDLGSQKRGSVYYLQAVRLQDGREVGRGPLEIRVPLLPARREALGQPDLADLGQARKLREAIFRDFGFRPEAARHIRDTSAVEVKRLDHDSGGGGWAPWDRLVILETTQREAAVHEFAHVWWHDRRRTHPEAPAALARDVVRLAGMDPGRSPEYAEAIAFARGYVHGVGDWKGMYPGVRDPRHLTREDLRTRVLDWEIFAGFCSWTMGDFQRGSRRLPSFMARHLQPLFTGRIRAVPYYRGGPP